MGLARTILGLIPGAIVVATAWLFWEQLYPVLDQVFWYAGMLSISGYLLLVFLQTVIFDSIEVDMKKK